MKNIHVVSKKLTRNCPKMVILKSTTIFYGTDVTTFSVRMAKNAHLFFGGKIQMIWNSRNSWLNLPVLSGNHHPRLRTTRTCVLCCFWIRCDYFRFRPLKGRQRPWPSVSGGGGDCCWSWFPVCFFRQMTAVISVFQLFDKFSIHKSKLGLIIGLYVFWNWKMRNDFKFIS